MKADQPLRILFVEDVPSDVELAERKLQKEGLQFTSTRVETKPAFFKALKEFAPDLIISDYALPEFDGMQALKLSLEHDSRMPFILLTGSMNEETAVACMKAGATDYVIKEHIARLPFAVKDALEQKKIRVEREEAEQELRESERKLKEAQRLGRIGHWEFDLDTQKIHWSDMVFTLYERDPKLGPPTAEEEAAYYSPEDAERLRNCAQRSIETGEPYIIDVRVNLPGGRSMDAVAIGTPVKDAHGRVIRLLGTIQDITERKRAEKQIALLAHSVKSIIECVSITDMNDTLLFVNEAFLTTYGYDEHELLGKNIEIVRSPNNPPEVVREIRDATLGAGWHGELLNRTKDGREFPVSLSTSSVRDDTGQAVALVGVATDITERKKAEEALRNSEEKLRLVFENAYDGISIFEESPDPNQRKLVDCNLRYAEMAGRTWEELIKIGNTLELARTLSEDNSQSIEQGVAFRGSFSWIRPDGKDNIIEYTAVPIRMQGKTFTIGIDRDITERKRAEAALASERNLLRTLIDNMPDRIYAKDTEGRFIICNKSLAIRMGMANPDEIVGKSDFDFLPQELAAQFRADEQEIIRSGQSLINREEPMDSLSGETRWSLATKVPLRDNQGTVIGIVGMGRDITERKRAAEALARERDLLRGLMNNIPDAIYFKDAESHFLQINPSQARRFGLSDAAEAIGKTDFDFFTEEHARPAYEDEQRIMKTGQPLVGSEEKETWPDGRETWVSTTKAPMRDVNGQIIGTFGISRDITERKRAEDALRENEQRLKVALTCADIAVFNQDKDLRYTWMFNPHLGFLPEEIIGKTDRELFSRADLSRVLETKQKVLESGIGVSEEVLITLNQQEISVLLSVEPLRDSSGTIVGLTGAMIDITERKLSQQRLEQERNLLRTLIEAIPDEIAVKDVERRFVLVNPACVRALRKESAGDVLGKRDEDLIAIEFADDGKLQEEQVLSSGKPFVNIEGKTRLDPVTGEIKRSILITKMPLRDKDGTITGLVVINRDITERKRAEVEIQRSRDWLNAILDASRDGIVAEKNEMIVYANAPYAHIYGYDEPAELTGQHVSLVQSELDNTRMLQFGRRRLDGERMPEVYEFKGRKKDGRFIDLEASVSTASIAGDEHIVATVRDITERKLLQKQLIEAQKMESIGTLAGGIAHDFNNILGIIMGHASILEQMRPDPEKFLQSIQAINKATYRGANLVRQLLTFARKTDVTMQSVLINDILNELAKLLEDTLPKTIVMELNLEKKLPSILADPTQLHQVFLNLCVNARDAIMPKGGSISIASRIIRGASVLAKFDRADAMEYIVIDVADTGTGIDEATRSRIFEPFFTTKEKGKGTGLGLATVYGIVESHRGFIDVESTVGVGSTFHVYLPVEPRQVKRDELEKVAEKEIPGGTETILVVEDEETLRDLVSFVLEGKGYRVLRASDGEEGLQLFTERMQEIALVLSDLGLPKISGEDLFRRMRQLKPEAKVILATGYIEPGTKSELLKAGARELIQKPYVPAEVLKKIREALDSAV